ncbi:MAG: DUF692 domain-containing protein [Gammaproteobacteria bacterium]
MQISGTGLGLRREFLAELRNVNPHPINFLEIAPENWMNIGGKRKNFLEYYAKHYPMICHGLSLSLGGIAPLNTDFIADLKIFLDTHNIALYSEHLSFCNDEQGQLYDLLPIPFTQEAVLHIANRIREVQDRLERKISVENASYYYQLPHDLSESEFINAVISEAQCDLLLDVNNVYVNKINHGTDPLALIRSLPSKHIAYIHVAGHYQKSPNLIIDTHGDKVIDPVWDLLEFTYKTHGVKPTLLERDNDVPPLNELLNETKVITSLQVKHKEVVSG